MAHKERVIWMVAGGVIGLVAFVLLLLISVATLSGPYDPSEDQLSQRENLLRQKAEQLQTIRHYSWVDREAGTVTIPIDRAMELVIEERTGDQ
jgi:hypothetical protein